MPRIYVACLASYNNGTLHGAWIDAAQDADAIREAIADMLSHSKYPNVMVKCPDCNATGHNMVEQPADRVACESCLGKGEYLSAEEWAIHDYEGFCGIKLSESHDLDEVAALAVLIDEVNDEDLIDAASDVCDGSNVDELKAAIEDRFRGVHDSEADYAQQLIEGCYDTKAMGNLANYIDYEAFARDLRMGGDCYFIRKGGSVYVFDAN